MIQTDDSGESAALPAFHGWDPRLPVVVKLCLTKESARCPSNPNQMDTVRGDR